jgi:hypothetical protein
MPDDWSHEETDDPLYADRRNFYKVEKWSRSFEHSQVAATHPVEGFRDRSSIQQSNDFGLRNIPQSIRPAQCRGSCGCLIGMYRSISTKLSQQV